MRSRIVLSALALSATAATAAGGDAAVPTAMGGSDVEVLDEHAWVEAVSRRRQEVASAPAPVEVVLIEDLLHSPASTIPDRLRYLPGVDVYQLRHGQFEVGLRGYDGPMNSRILVLQDGWQFAQPDLQAPIWSGTIFLSDLERIEVAKGPASVTYGANAFGGVISMTSREVGDRPRMVVVADAGWPHAAEGDATVSGPLGRAFYGKLSAGYTRLEDLPGVKTGVPYQSSPRNGDDTRLDLVAWRARALVGERLGDDVRVEAGVRVLHRDPWEVVDGAAQGPPSIAIDDRLATLELHSNRLRISLSERRFYSDYGNLQSTYVPAADFSYLQFGFADAERTARAQLDSEIGPHRLGVGVEGSHFVSRSNLWVYGAPYGDQSAWGEVSYSNLAAFAEDQWRLADRWQLTAGVRGDRDTRVGTHVSPRVAVNWAPDRHQFALLSWSQGYRLPSPLESFEHDYFVKPSDDLQAERIQSIEALWRLRDGRDLELSIGGFWNRANDLIWRLPLPSSEQSDNFQNWLGKGAPSTIGPGPFFQFDNLNNPYTVYGAETSARVRIPDSPLTAWTNGTWQLGRYRDAVHFSSPGVDASAVGLGTIYQYDYTVPRDANAPPEWKANLGLDWDSGHWFASSAGRYVSGRTVYDIGATRLFRNTLIAIQHLNPYAALDLSLGYRFGSGNGRFVRLSVMDLFDSGHSEFYRESRDNLLIANEAQYSSDIGRQINLTAGWEF